MVMCFVPHCRHYSEQKTCRRFFSFPRRGTLRRKWINLIRRGDREPSRHSLVCSCHFVNGNRINRPTLFDSSLFEAEAANKLKRCPPETKHQIQSRKKDSDSDKTNTNQEEYDGDSSETLTAPSSPIQTQPTRGSSEDRLNEEYDLNTPKSSPISIIDASEPEALDIKMEFCENPVEVKEEKDVSKAPQDDVLGFVRSEQLSLPVTEKTIKRPANFGVEINQLNRSNNETSTLTNFEVKALPEVEEGGYSQTVVLEIKVKPGKGYDPSGSDKTEQLRKDLNNLEKIARLQKIIAAQEKKIADLTQIVNDLRSKVINQEHDYGLPH